MPSANKIQAHEFSRAEIESRFDATIGHTLGEIDSSGALSSKPSNKGSAGNVFEQSVLGYPADSRQEPDLLVDGVPTELKVTGLIGSPRSKRGWRAKEPMSITAVSPDAIVHEEFSTSTFWDKAEHLLIVYYLYVKPGKGVKFAQWATFEVKGYEFHVWNEIDVTRLKADWTTVRDFVRRALELGREEWMPRLSTDINPQLLYLDTSPKYPNPPRFRFKNSFVTAIAAEYFTGPRADLPLIQSMSDLDRALAGFADSWRGKTLGEIARECGIQRPSGKSLAEQALVRMFTGRPGKMSSINLFSKASIQFKSITLTSKGGRTEDMKLQPAIDFDDLLNPDKTFEDSLFEGYFNDTSAICAVFQEPHDNCDLSNTVFLGFKRVWLGQLLDDAQRLWSSMRRLVFKKELVDVPKLDKFGNQKTTPKTGLPESAPNWPKSRDGVLFVRGSGSDARDKTVVVNGIQMYRQNVWIRGRWVVEELSRQKFLEF